jgi:hypothetical protein
MYDIFSIFFDIWSFDILGFDIKLLNPISGIKMLEDFTHSLQYFAGWLAS